MAGIRTPSDTKRFGYFLAFVTNFFIMNTVNNLLNWNVPYFTERFSECLGTVNLSLGVLGFMYFIFMFFDPKWFRSFMQAIANVFSLISLYVFREVFPLDLSDSMEMGAKLGIVILLVLFLLSILVELIKSIKFYRRNATR